MYCAERFTPSLAFVDFETTILIVAFLATAPDHSTSRSASVSSLELKTPRKEFDIGLPVLTPTLVRKKSLAEEIATLDVMSFQSMLLPLTADDPNNQTFRYEGQDIITLLKVVERDKRYPCETAQEVIGYYARRIAKASNYRRSSLF